MRGCWSETLETRPFRNFPSVPRLGLSAPPDAPRTERTRSSRHPPRPAARARADARRRRGRILTGAARPNFGGVVTFFSFHNSSGLTRLGRKSSVVCFGSTAPRSARGDAHGRRETRGCERRPNVLARGGDAEEGQGAARAPRRRRRRVHGRPRRSGMPQCYGARSWTFGARSGRAAVARVQHRRQARLAAPLERHPGGTRGPPGGDRRRARPQLGDDRARASRRAIVRVLLPGHRGAGARAEALGLFSSHDGGAGDARERGAGPRTRSIERRDVVRGHAGQERRCEPIGDEPPSRRAAPLIGRILPDFQFPTFEFSHAFFDASSSIHPPALRHDFMVVSWIGFMPQFYALVL